MAAVGGSGHVLGMAWLFVILFTCAIGFLWLIANDYGRFILAVLMAGLLIGLMF